MNYLFRQKLKNFFENLTVTERCIFKEYFQTHQTQEEVGQICYDPPRSTATVNGDIKKIKEKYDEYVIEV